MSTASEAWLGTADEAIRRWQAFLKNDLAAVNGELQKANQKPLVVTVNTQTDPSE